MEERYLVESSYGGDIFVEVYETLQDANIAAEQEWKRLTKRERKKITLEVLRVTEEDLDEDCQEEGKRDWTAWSTSSYVEGEWTKDAEISLDGYKTFWELSEITDEQIEENWKSIECYMTSYIKEDIEDELADRNPNYTKRDLLEEYLDYTEEKLIVL